MLRRARSTAANGNSRATTQNYLSPSFRQVDILRLPDRLWNESDRTKQLDYVFNLMGDNRRAAHAPSTPGRDHFLMTGAVCARHLIQMPRRRASSYDCALPSTIVSYERKLYMNFIQVTQPYGAPVPLSELSESIPLVHPAVAVAITSQPAFAAGAGAGARPHTTNVPAPQVSSSSLRSPHTSRSPYPSASGAGRAPSPGGCGSASS